MKTILYYFTGTGNSLAVARAIADRLPDTELIPIPMLLLDGEKIRAQKDANIGVISPLYAMGLPGLVVIDSSTSSTSQTPATSFPSSPKAEPTAPPPVR